MIQVIGWEGYDDNFRSADNTEEELQAVAHALVQNGYKFGGDDHENHGSCAPVLSNGKMYRTSWRGWGGVMAYAYNLKANDQKYSYSLWYMGEYAPEKQVFPPYELKNYPQIENGVTHTIQLDKQVVQQLSEQEVAYLITPVRFDQDISGVCAFDTILFTDQSGTVLAKSVVMPNYHYVTELEKVFEVDTDLSYSVSQYSNLCCCTAQNAQSYLQQTCGCSGDYVRVQMLYSIQLV